MSEPESCRLEPYRVDAHGFGGFGEVLLRTAELNGAVASIQEQAVAAAQLNDRNRQSHVLKQGWEFEQLNFEIERLTRAVMYSRGQQSLLLKVKGNKTKAFAAASGHRWGLPLGAGRFPGPVKSDVMVVTTAPTLQDFANGRLLSSGEGSFLSRYLREEGAKGFGSWYITSLIKTIYPEKDSQFKISWWNSQKYLFLQEYAIVRPKYILAMGSSVLKALLGSRATMKATKATTREFELNLIEDVEGLHEHYRSLAAYHDWTVKYNRILKSAHTKWVKHPELSLDALVEELVEAKKLGEEPPIVDIPPVDTIRSTVVGCPSPRAAMMDPDSHDDFRQAVNRATRVICEGASLNKPKDSVRKLVVRTEHGLRKLITKIRKENTSGILAVDAEWNGEHPQNDNYYIRTVQVCWDHDKGAAIVLHAPGGEVEFKCGPKDNLTTEGSIPVAVDLINEMVKGYRLAGHFLGSDIEMVDPVGIDFLTGYEPAEDPEDVVEKGGIDTAFLAHAISETDEFNLNYQYLKHTDYHRYDIELNAEKERYCSQHKLKPDQLEGYGFVSDEILIPYGIFDVLVTYEIALKLLPQLKADRFGNDVRRAYWLTHVGYMGAIEMVKTGLLVDKSRMDKLTMLFLSKAESLKAKLRAWARWPEFNPNSVFQVRELLFGVKHNGKLDKDGNSIRLRPEGARSLNAEPMLCSGKRQKFWEQLVSQGLDKEHSPATGGKALGIMYHEGDQLKVRRDGEIVIRDYKEILGLLRDYKTILQALRVSLRAPVGDPDEGYEEEDDELIYDEGVPSKICGDGRLRGRFFPTKETGRWSISSPNLQNWSKRKEADYSRILGDRYLYPVRSMITAPEGYIYLEADYTGAELLGMAIYSGDKRMIEHAIRGQLPEDHPDYYDIHANVGVRAFKFDCEPTKKGLSDIGQGHMRIAAKSVIFGYAYGQQPAAVVITCRADGVAINYDDAVRLQQALEDLYPELPDFFQSCRDVVSIQHRIPGETPRLYIRGMKGRYRRFHRTDDRKLIGDYERQCMNFPLQNLVADAIDEAIYHLRKARNEHFKETGEWLFDMCLQVHDALTFQVAVEHVDKAVPLIKECMVDKVELRRCDLLGRQLDDKVYRFGADMEFFKHWSIKLKKEDCVNLGIDERYGK